MQADATFSHWDSASRSAELLQAPGNRLRSAGVCREIPGSCPDVPGSRAHVRGLPRDVPGPGGEFRGECRGVPVCRPRASRGETMSAGSLTESRGIETMSWEVRRNPRTTDPSPGTLPPLPGSRDPSPGLAGPVPGVCGISRGSRGGARGGGPNAPGIRREVAVFRGCFWAAGAAPQTRRAPCGALSQGSGASTPDCGRSPGAHLTARLLVVARVPAPGAAGK